eukprot:TRINITY_DN8716_c0_g1_i1.p1 TRINITY_DN8716_c0_g1~~TRINITY_DN8716_c0_g1_i1.p1  ORF type:complete len:698 (+),score=89.13 TRINITY_DN8716_c0_g1_i1:64-2157(+)
MAHFMFCILLSLQGSMAAETCQGSQCTAFKGQTLLQVAQNSTKVSVPAACQDDHSGMIEAAKTLQFTIAGCMDVADRCQDPDHGSTIRAKCPQTCGPTACSSASGCYMGKGICQAFKKYVPGTPGGSWSLQTLTAIKAKIRLAIFNGPAVTAEAKVDASLGLPFSLARLVRLGFHDCFLYKDGSGGCDGCLEWTYVGKRGDWKKIGGSWNTSDGSNNGLQPTVEVLEQIYINKAFPFEAPRLELAPIDMGISRADLWAFASMVAIEIGLELNDQACKNGAAGPPFTNFHNCHPRFGASDCLAPAPRPFKFTTGRSDCIPDKNDPRVDKPYKTWKKENHPDSGGNGEKTLNFMKKDYKFNGRETVAIMGAHTLGSLHIDVSNFKYTWLAMSGSLVNNMYYRNMVEKEDWYYPREKRNEIAIDRNCAGIGNSKGERPKARWRLNNNNELPKDPRCPTCGSGPVQWINEKLICSCWDSGGRFLNPNSCTAGKPDPAGCTLADKDRWWPNQGGCCAGLQLCTEQRPISYEAYCAASDPNHGKTCWSTVQVCRKSCGPQNPKVDIFGCKPGTETWRFIPGVDETMLNSDMGLYRNFSEFGGWPLDTGLCPGLKVGLHWEWFNVTSTAGGCPYNTIREPPSDLPMYQIVEQYANSNSAWLQDFFPAYEKMLLNGYDISTSTGLSTMPMPATTCDRSNAFMQCP